MARFMISSCGVLAEMSHVALAEDVLIVVLAALSLSCTLRIWSSDLFRFVDHLVGCDRQVLDDGTKSLAVEAE
jgi:hypothetical protein